MTPSYVEVDRAVDSKYQVYLYQEQGWETESRNDARPVIFVPGNAGSYRQVRSFASSAARQYATELSEKQHAAGMAPLDFYTGELGLVLS